MLAFLLNPPKRFHLSWNLSFFDLFLTNFYFCIPLNSLILSNFSFIFEGLEESTLQGDFERAFLGDLSRDLFLAVTISSTLTVSRAV
jgi:hypothetical protein